MRDPGVYLEDMVAHYYFGLEDSLVLETVRTHVPTALPRLREMLARIDEEYPRP